MSDREFKPVPVESLKMEDGASGVDEHAGNATVPSLH